MMSWPAISLSTFWLESCRKDSLLKEGGFRGKVAIVGAGAAGLQCASILKAQGCDVVVFEMQNKILGRVAQVAGFDTHPIDLGAEWIHGPRSILHDTAIQLGFAPQFWEKTDYFLLSNQLNTEADFYNYPPGATLLQTVEGLENYPGPDQSVQQYLQGFIEPNLFPIANALIGNTYGTDNSRLSMRAIADEAKMWTSGSRDLLLSRGSLFELLDQLYTPVKPLVRLNHQATAIDYSTDQVILTLFNNGNTFTETFDRVVVAVPLTVLKSWQQQNIWNPALPAAKVSALDALGMEPGVKVVLKFSEAFWPEDFGGYVGGMRCPEYWVTNPYKPGAAAMLTGFFMGDYVNALEAQSVAYVPWLLQELSQIFGNNKPIQNFQGDIKFVWDESNLAIGGAYSYPKPGAGNARQRLASAIDSKVFFAGEAVNTNGHASTVHGAMETGIMAALAVLNHES